MPSSLTAVTWSDQIDLILFSVQPGTTQLFGFFFFKFKPKSKLVNVPQGYVYTMVALPNTRASTIGPSLPSLGREGNLETGGRGSEHGSERNALW